MTVVGEEQLSAFIQRHASAKKPLQAWLATVRYAQWKNPQALRDQFRTADFRSGHRVIFNIGGNNFRLLVKVAYPLEVVQVLWLGTHAEYDRMKF